MFRDIVCNIFFNKPWLWLWKGRKTIVDNQSSEWKGPYDSWQMTSYILLLNPTSTNSTAWWHHTSTSPHNVWEDAANDEELCHRWRKKRCTTWGPHHRGVIENESTGYGKKILIKICIWFVYVQCVDYFWSNRWSLIFCGSISRRYFILTTFYVAAVAWQLFLAKCQFSQCFHLKRLFLYWVTWLLQTNLVPNPTT